MLESNPSASVVFIRKTADLFRRFFIAVKHKAINSVFPLITSCFRIVSISGLFFQHILRCKDIVTFNSADVYGKLRRICKNEKSRLCGTGGQDV